MWSRFFNTWGAHQFNAGSLDIPWRWEYYAVSAGWDYFRSIIFSQDVDPSLHWQHTCHPTVEQGRDALPFTTIFWSSIDSSVLVLRKSIMSSNNMFWFPSGSHCEYMDLSIAFAVNSFTSPSSNCTVYYRMSKIGLSDARPEVFPSMSRLRPVTCPLDILVPLGIMMSTLT